MRNSRQSQRGVTLLEALISVALLAALSALLAPSLFSTMRGSSKILQTSASRETYRIAEDALNQILSNAVIMDASDPQLRIGGDAGSLQVISLAGGSVARRFSLEIENGRLTGEIAPLLDGDDQVQAAEILASGAMKFSYYGQRAPETVPAWNDQWSGGQPPQLVRFESAPQSENGAPVILDIAVTVRGSLHCQFDPVSRRCRN